jgi:predicted Zn-dependent protease
MRIGSSILAALVSLTVLGCASGLAAPDKSETYLRWVAFEMPGNEQVVLRWQKRQMPLRVYLPPPPDGLFEDPEGIHASVRDAVLEWADVVEPGLPSFTFVSDAGSADIPIVWAAEPDGDWYIAHCTYDIGWRTRRFGVSRILVTGRWGRGVADLHDVYATIVHAMGHALGLGGHSPEESDIMYPSISETAVDGLSERDPATLAALYARPNGSRVGGAR